MPFGDAAESGHDLSRCAKAALQTVMFNKGALQGVQLAVFFEPFNRFYAGSTIHGGECQTGKDPLAIDQNCAGTACTLVTAFLRAGEVQPFPKDV